MRSELVITVKDTINPETLSDILLIQGHLNFYETVNKEEVLKYFRKKSSVCIQDAFTLLHLRDSIHLKSEPILGIAGAKDTISINTCFSSKEVKALLPRYLRLLWTIYPGDNKQYFLYCVSSSDKHFNEQNIIESHADFEDPEHPTLCITFKEKVWKLWENATIRNMNKSVTLVIDDKVYSAPRILGEIPHGKISLTGGGFSKTEVRKLVAVISNGTLPLKFTVVSNK
jgi:SecD/SecF fusion protein